jgi:precorrin-6B methylase 2
MLTFARNVIQRVRTHGLGRSAVYALARLDDAVWLRRRGIRAAYRATEVYVQTRDLGYQDPNWFYHEPTPSCYTFRAAMRRFVRPTRNDVFLDYGSGLGRVVLMAAAFPLRKVIGVEYSAQLCRDAERILAPVRPRLRCPQVELVQADAGAYQPPDDATIFYFFNPFGGETLEKALANLRGSLRRAPRKITVLSYNPVRFEKAVAACPWLVKRGELRFPSLTPCPTVIYEHQPGATADV